MAHVYIPLLLTAQPRGQFRLGGYCNGGLLAWEIAHRLHHAGREVESVTLINTFSLNARPLLRGFNRLLCGLTPFVQPSTSRSRVGRSLMSALWKLGRSRPNRFKRAAQVVASRFRGKHFTSISDTRNASYMCDGELHPSQAQLRRRGRLRRRRGPFRSVDFAVDADRPRRSACDRSW
jgi:thioesterase domain-containing protein